MSNTPLKLINMDEVTTVPVKWLWKPYIPLGKITIIQGDPGEGIINCCHSTKHFKSDVRTLNQSFHKLKMRSPKNSAKPRLLSGIL